MQHDVREHFLEAWIGEDVTHILAELVLGEVLTVPALQIAMVPVTPEIPRRIVP